MCDLFLFVVGGISFLLIIGWAANKTPILGILVFLFGGFVIVYILLALLDAVGLTCRMSGDNCETEYSRSGPETHCTPE